MAEINGGVIAARQLKKSGIDTMFGVVAGPMIELFGGGAQENLKVVGCRHEINGGFMASSWGWQKKKPGVLVVGSGPAMTNAITPLYVATESVLIGPMALGSALAPWVVSQIGLEPTLALVGVAQLSSRSKQF